MLLLRMLTERAGYDVKQVAATALWNRPWLRPLHDVLLPLVPTVTIIATPRPNFMYPSAREMQYLPTWAMDLAPYHQDYEPESKARAK